RSSSLFLVSLGSRLLGGRLLLGGGLFSLGLGGLFGLGLGRGLLGLWLGGGLLRLGLGGRCSLGVVGLRRGGLLGGRLLGGGSGLGRLVGHRLGSGSFRTGGSALLGDFVDR